MRKSELFSSVALLCLLPAACTKTPSSSSISSGNDQYDIFKEDEDGVRRRSASNDEINWAIKLSMGCTAHLIANNYLMSANHCGVSTGTTGSSGYAITNGEIDDVTVESVVESDAQLDYIIAKIKWSRGQRPPSQKIPSSVATSESDVSASVSPDSGDPIFTVGFPIDQQQFATYSEGEVKEFRDPAIAYNMGIINGNSGGPVYTKSGNMLISLTNSGPHGFQQPGWDQNDKDDPKAWNWGSAMWLIYQNSTILQKYYPGGQFDSSVPD